MSRNDLFLLMACAIVATVLSGSPVPPALSSGPVIESLISSASFDGAAGAPSFQQSLDHP